MAFFFFCGGKSVTYTVSTKFVTAGFAFVRKRNSPKSSSLPSHLKELPNNEIAQLVLSNELKDHELEKKLDPHRAVDVRRIVATAKLRSALGQPDSDPLEHLPSQPSLDYSRVHGANCEMVVGHVPLPVGLVGL